MNFNKNELNSAKWERTRKYILTRDEYIDQVKKRYGKRVGADTVHHIFPREFFPEFTFETWNLVSVSRQTHNALHDRETHGLTSEGWALLVRTARSRGMEIDENLKSIICAGRKSE